MFLDDELRLVCPKLRGQLNFVINPTNTVTFRIGCSSMGALLLLYDRFIFDGEVERAPLLPNGLHLYAGLIRSLTKLLSELV